MPAGVAAAGANAHAAGASSMHQVQLHHDSFADGPSPHHLDQHAAVAAHHDSFVDGPSPHHLGQQAVQARMGVRQQMEDVGRRVIRRFLNAQARQFFQELPFVAVGLRNLDGKVWATMLCGEPGFMRADGDLHLDVEVRQMRGDPARLALGSALGAVGVMLHNRRRNKLNGVVEALQPGRLRLRITHSLGNCPKYIQLRTVQLDAARLAALGTEERPLERGGPELGPEQSAFLARADTAFLATHFAGRAGGRDADALEYASCNHRGGPPGFIKLVSPSLLRIPDYVGNSLYQSLGNILVSAPAGLQVVDFATGDSLQLTGQAEILFNDRSLPGAQRAVSFAVSEWVHVKGGLPFTTVGPVEPSPYNPAPEAAGEGAAARLACVGRRGETRDIETFRFALPPGQGGASFCEAGQFASFDFPGLQDGATLNRTWTVSSPPEEVARTGTFTISVKRAGRVSGWLHDRLAPGGEVLFRGVGGEFTLDRAAKCIPAAGVLLLAGGIGVTPMRVMWHECLARRIPVTLLYSVRTAGDAAFLDEFREASREVAGAKLAVTLTAGAPGEAQPGVATFHGRLTAAMIQQVCPDAAAREAFQCGPQAMMSAAAAALESLGVPAASIHEESFSF